MTDSGSTIRMVQVLRKVWVLQILTTSLCFLPTGFGSGRTEGNGPFRWAVNCTYENQRNFLMSSPVPGPEECGSWCLYSQRCSGFYIHPTARGCFGSPLEPTNTKVKDTGTFCGYLIGFFKWTYNHGKEARYAALCSYGGGEGLVSSDEVAEDVLECIKVCSRDPQCTHFDFEMKNTGDDGGKCRLYHGFVYMASNADYAAASVSHCGYMVGRS